MKERFRINIVVVVAVVVVELIMGRQKSLMRRPIISLLVFQINSVASNRELQYDFF
jgi:hypothetical protein